jgi:hypothetical protein
VSSIIDCSLGSFSARTEIADEGWIESDARALISASLPEFRAKQDTKESIKRRTKRRKASPF